MKSHDEVQHFERSLAAVNVKYSVRTSRDTTSNSLKSNVVFSMIHCGRRISIDNVPFRVVKETAKVCMFGVEYYKKTEKQKDQGPTTTDRPKEVCQKKRISLQGTRKKGCTATLHFKYIELYPDFKVEIPKPCGRIKGQRLQSDKVREVNEALQTKKTVTTDCRVYVRVSDWQSHCNHVLSEIEAFSQSIDRDVVVFKHIVGWSFSSPPCSYLNGPEITLGSCPPSETHSDVSDVSELNPSEAPQQALNPENEALGNPTVSVLRKAIAEELEKCSSLLHHCHDVEALTETKQMFESAFRRLAKAVPYSCGLHIRGSPTKKCSSLKHRPKRKRLQ